MPKNIIKLIIIRGPLGIGKTTVAKLLAKKLSGQYISIDDILHKNKLDLTEDNIPLKNFLKANELIVTKYKNCRRPLVVDGNFYFKRQIQDLLKKIPGVSYIFTLRAPLSVCIERNRNRGLQYSDDATRAVYNLSSKFNYGIAIETRNKTSKIVMTKIINYLK